MNVGKDHEWLMTHVFFMGDDGDSILSVRGDVFCKPGDAVILPVFDRKNVAPEHFNLLRASPMLYQQLTYQYVVLQAMIDAFDKMPNFPGVEEWVANLTNAQNGILLSQRAAIEGVEKVAAELDKPEPPNAHNTKH